VARNTIPWDEEPECQKVKAFPKLEHQNTCLTTNSNIFSQAQTSKGQLLLETKNKMTRTKKTKKCSVEKKKKKNTTLSLITWVSN
jgi:hypothetical protein